MDFEISSAAALVPRIGEQLTQSLCSFKDRFILDCSAIPDQPTLSPLFQSIQESCPTDGIHFHHHEEVVVSSDSQSTFLPIDDLDSIDTNDLFSFLLDEQSTIDSNNSTDNKPFNLTPFFGSPLAVSPSAQLSTDLDIPLDILNVVDFPLVDSSNHKSNSSFLSDSPLMEEFNLSSGSPYCSGADDSNNNGDNNYVREDLECIERGIASGRRDRSNNNSDLPLYLHNEDLIRGKPGQRLVLTAEEKRLLVQMGQRVPTTFPLMRSEERAIKTMRRKIRNKISAKASRARRQEYLSDLEYRIEDCHKQNQRLRGRVTELEEDKRGLLANLRQMRSYLARVLSSTSSTKKSNGSIPPLLPLTVSRQQHRHERRLHSGKPVSLLLVAFLILASATTLSLPNLSASDSAKGISNADQGILSGRSRVLLNWQTEVDYASDQKGVKSPRHPVPIVSDFDDQDDGIPIIKTKIHSFNKGVNQASIQPVKKEVEQIDSLLLSMHEKIQGRLMSKDPNIELQDRSFPPYSVEDL